MEDESFSSLSTFCFYSSIDSYRLVKSVITVLNYSFFLKYVFIFRESEMDREIEMLMREKHVP